MIDSSRERREHVEGWEEGVVKERKRERDGSEREERDKIKWKDQKSRKTLFFVKKNWTEVKIPKKNKREQYGKWNERKQHKKGKLEAIERQEYQACWWVHREEVDQAGCNEGWQRRERICGEEGEMVIYVCVVGQVDR